MRDPAGRLLSLLQTPREWSGPELAARFGVTARTIRRDIDRLRGPVHAIHGNTAGRRWYLLAHDEDHAGWRTFRAGTRGSCCTFPSPMAAEHVTAGRASWNPPATTPAAAHPVGLTAVPRSPRHPAARRLPAGCTLLDPPGPAPHPAAIAARGLPA